MALSLLTFLGSWASLFPATATVSPLPIHVTPHSCALADHHSDSLSSPEDGHLPLGWCPPATGAAPHMQGMQISSGFSSNCAEEEHLIEIVMSFS